jgi:hypothetical protein
MVWRLLANSIREPKSTADFRREVSMTTANTGRKQRGRPFKPGQSGNPKGRPVGSKHKATLAAMALMEGDIEQVTQVCIDKAKEGDLLAVKLILDKVIPQARERHISLRLPNVEGAPDIPVALAAVLGAVGNGTLTPGEGQSLAAMIEAYRRGLELTNIDARLMALEQMEVDK